MYMRKKDVLKLYDKYVLSTYNRVPIVLVRGKGARVWDIEGKEYLDFFPGWAVSGLGHCHPKVVAALKGQAARMIHVSNNYYNELQPQLAREISKSSFGGKVFFCNSGAEANESAIKLARAYGNPTGRFEIITMENSFHGRTIAAMSATGQPKYNQGFGPLLEGFRHVPFGDTSALQAAITDKTVAIMLEPIQGEGGINVAKAEYISAIRDTCKKSDLLLILDEVQTGIGRTGKMFCYQHYGIEPDVMTLAKTLGGGVPIGAMVAAQRLSDVLKPGMHASTFGGSPIVCAAALAVFDTIKRERLLSNVNRMSRDLFSKLNALKTKYSFIKEVRGIGLMVGVELDRSGKKVYEVCTEEGLLINCTHECVLRLMPPLDVTREEIDEAMNILGRALERESRGG
jgi:acetylornithine/N-succinyldiaminopimelate aminotransferase